MRIHITTAQARWLRVLAKHPSGRTWIDRRVGKALVRKGLASRASTGEWPGIWQITPEGRAALREWEQTIDAIRHGHG